MEIDYTSMAIVSLIVVIVVLIFYEYRKPREMRGISPKVLLNRFKESMDVLSEAAKQKCFRCGKLLRVLTADLYEKNELKLVCEPCGITEVWKRKEGKVFGKVFKETQWVLTIHETTEEEKKTLEALREAKEKLKKIEEARRAPPGMPAPPQLRGSQKEK